MFEAKKIEIDFGQQKVAFAPFNLGELRKLKSVTKNDKGLDLLLNVMPLLASAAKRGGTEITQDQLEELVDLDNFDSVFTAMMGGSVDKNQGGVKPEPSTGA